MSETIVLKVKKAHDLAWRALRYSNTRAEVANYVASALVYADADGQKSHGIMRIPSYVEQLNSNKVDGIVTPRLVYKDAATILVDANYGFAYPALGVAVKVLTSNREFPAISMAAITNSHHCGVAGLVVERLARSQRIGLVFSNTPKALAPPGGNAAVFGTNPIAFGCPRYKQDPIVIDLSLARVARGKIKQAELEKKSIPDTWATDSKGVPTTDPTIALAGQMQAMGGVKGAALAMMVEILTGALVGSNFSYEASSFFSPQGAPPRIGQMVISIKPKTFSNQFFQRIEELANEMLKQPDTHLPGQNRFINRRKALMHGIEYQKDLIDHIRDLTSVNRNYR